MTDIVDRLEPAKWWTIDSQTRQLMKDARAEILRLRADNAAITEANNGHAVKVSYLAAEIVRLREALFNRLETVPE